MKLQRNEKYASIAMYACIAVCISAIVIMCVFNLGKVGQVVKSGISAISPVIYGFVIAYLANHILVFFETKVLIFKKSKKDLHTLRRTLSIILTFVVIAGVLAVILVAIVPQAARSVKDLASQINTYISNIQSFADNLVKDYSKIIFDEQYNTLTQLLSEHDISFNLKAILSNSFSVATGALNYVVGYGGAIVGSVINIVLSVILAIYFLACKEKIASQTKKLLAAMAPRRTYLNIVRLARYTHKTFGGFIAGKIIDATVVGLITFVVLMIFKVPYYPLLAVIVGVPNVIPTFGPIFGGVCGGLLLIIVDPSKLILYIIVILIIQQIDGNFLEPQILGDSLGISAMWVILAIVVSSALFGFGGLVVGVPAFSVIYVLIKQWTERRLKNKGYPYHTEYYELDPGPELDKIEPEYVFIDKETAVIEPTADDDIIISKKEKVPLTKRLTTAIKKNKSTKKGDSK